MTTRKPPSQLELEFRGAVPGKTSKVVEFSTARRRIEQRQRGALYEAIISRAAHLLAPPPSPNGKKKA